MARAEKLRTEKQRRERFRVQGLKIREKKGFRGGIHVTDGRDKQLSSREEIVDYEPEAVAVSMGQAKGSRCRLLVKAGDRVQAGQKIGEPDTPAGVPVHASISGIIEKIEMCRDRDGNAAEVCVIRREQEEPFYFREKEEGLSEKNNSEHPELEEGQEIQVREIDRIVKKYQWDYRKRLVDLGGISRDEILYCLKEGGIVGMGGAGFPAFRKYATERRVHTLLVNGAECEPYLTCDHRLMLEHGMEILNGARLLARCVSAGKAFICIEANKPDAAAHLKKLLREDFSQVEVVTVPARYPQGGERQLIQTVLGMEVPEGGLPVDLGVIVSNVATAKAAADCVLGGKPLTHR